MLLSHEFFEELFFKETSVAEPLPSAAPCLFLNFTRRKPAQIRKDREPRAARRITN